MVPSRSPRSRRSHARSHGLFGRGPTSRAVQLVVETLEPRQMLSAVPLSFHVVDDASANRDYLVASNGTPQGSAALAAANAAPRGVATAVGVDNTWVVDANRNVYVYNVTGGLVGSWTAGSLATNATPEGIATDGKDVWIVDAKSDKVFRYVGAASRLSGSQNAASSFSLNSANGNAKDIVTDGGSLWVVDDASSTDRVFKYSVAGSLIGNWAISSANKSPTGIAIDPTNVGDIWIADSGSDAVYQYVAAAGRSSGSQAASASFHLANGNSQGLAVALNWVRQLGSAGGDTGGGVWADGQGNVYMSGNTSASLGGPNLGDADSFVSKYDAAGTLKWVRQLGTSAYDVSDGPSGDGLGNIFIPGITAGSLGAPNAGLNDAFVAKYDANGNLLWTRQFGTAADDYGHSVSADGLGNVYLSGETKGSLAAPIAGLRDVYLAKIDAAGNLLWTRQLGSAGSEYNRSVSADGMGNVYISGNTSGNLGGPNAGNYDVFVAKYDAAGNLQWVRQFGTAAYEHSHGVSADALGNVYVTGFTAGDLGAPNAGNYDPFVAKYDAEGNLQWLKQFGTAADDRDTGISTDDLGNVFMSGFTYGSLAGSSAGDADAFVVEYDAAGNRVWAKQFGTSAYDENRGVSADGLGNVYSSGYTYGSLGGPNAGYWDATLIKQSAPAHASAAVSKPLKAVDLAFAAMAWDANQQGPGDSTTISSGGKSRKAVG